jgi:purine-binding chemotaxis protein CheW
MAANNSNTLVDEKLAISLFLDSLLREPEEEIDLATPEIKPVVTIPEVELPTVEIIPEVKVQQEVVVEKKVETPAEIKVEITSEVNEETTASIVPEWANGPFQILLFEVAGLKLAVPLIELCGVIEWNDSVTEMPGHADFYMGILQHLDYKIAVIDTARMVLPANKLTQLVGENPRERVKHVVLIDDYRWGLACDKIGEVITLEPDEVRWRTSKTSRGWLAGTVIEHMCALLNSEGFSNMLEKGQEIEG